MGPNISIRYIRNYIRTIIIYYIFKRNDNELIKIINLKILI